MLYRNLSFTQSTEIISFTLLQDSLLKKDVLGFCVRRGTWEREDGARQASRRWDSLFQNNWQLCSSASHIHHQKAPLLLSSFSFSIGLSVSPSSLSNTLCPHLFLPASPVTPPPLTSPLTPSQPLGHSVCLYLRLCPSPCMPLPFIHSPIIFCFDHLSPVQSGSAERSGGTKPTAWTAHNFSSFDSD